MTFRKKPRQPSAPVRGPKHKDFVDPERRTITLVEFIVDVFGDGGFVDDGVVSAAQEEIQKRYQALKRCHPFMEAVRNARLDWLAKTLQEAFPECVDRLSEPFREDTGFVRHCEYCGKELPTYNGAIYCSDECALADA